MLTTILVAISCVVTAASLIVGFGFGFYSASKKWSKILKLSFEVNRGMINDVARLIKIAEEQFLQIDGCIGILRVLTNIVKERLPVPKPTPQKGSRKEGTR